MLTRVRISAATPSLLALTALILLACEREPELVDGQPSSVVHLLDEAEGLDWSDRLLLHEWDFASSSEVQEPWQSPADAPGTYLLRLEARPHGTIFDVEVLKGPVGVVAFLGAGPLDPNPLPADELEELRQAVIGSDRSRQRVAVGFATEGERTVVSLVIPQVTSEDAESSHLVLAVNAGGTKDLGRVSLRRDASFEIGSRKSLGERLETLPTAPALQQVNIATITRPALVLPGGTAYSVTATLPADARYLEFGMGALEGGDPAQFEPIRLQVTVGAENVEELSREFDLDPGESLEQALWNDERVSVEDFAGREVTFQFRAEAKAGHAVAVAHPRVIGNRALNPRKNLILISLDTLRADRVGATGGPAGLTPWIDGAAARGLTYRQAHSIAPYTLPTHGTIFTGQLPSEHGATKEHTRLRTGGHLGAPHLARILRDAGWSTAAFTGGGWLSPDFGFAEGFDSYGIHDFIPRVSSLRPISNGGPAPRGVQRDKWYAMLKNGMANRTRVETVLDWIESNRDRPFFLFLHSFATHEFAPPKEYLERFVGSDPEVKWGSGQQLQSKRMPGHFLKHPYSDAELEYLKQVYDATVAYADSQVGRILIALDEVGIREETLVVLVSDHGEEFFEHGWFGHARTLYQDQLRVPLVIVGPGVPAGVIDLPVSTIDLAPTILHYLDLEPDSRMTGDLLPTDPAGHSQGVPLFHEVDFHTALDSIRVGQWKLIHNLRRPESTAEWELYDIDADPAERFNLVDEHPELLEQLKQALLQKRSDLDVVQELLGSSATEVSQDTQDQLGDLGYY